MPEPIKTCGTCWHWKRTYEQAGICQALINRKDVPIWAPRASNACVHENSGEWRPDCPCWSAATQDTLHNEEEPMSDKEPKRIPRGSGSGKETAYIVEARVRGTPRELLGRILDGEWREMKFVEKEGGIPIRTCGRAHEHGLLDYPAAQALRWSLHALASFHWYAYNGLETRLVKHCLTHTYSIDGGEICEVVKGEDLSSIMPKMDKEK